MMGGCATVVTRSTLSFPSLSPICEKGVAGAGSNTGVCSMKFVRVEVEGGDPGSAWRAETDNGVSRPPAMALVYAVEIEPGAASDLLQRLNSQCPLPKHLEHVKRVWRRSRNDETEGRNEIQLLLLLCPIDGIEGLKSLCQEHSWQVESLKRMEVPLRMPRTRSEYEHWRGRAYWPTTFHEPKVQLRERAEEAATIRRIGKMILSPWLHSQKDVAVIVDPSLSLYPSIITVAEAGEATNLLTREPILMALDRVAKLQHAMGSTGNMDPSINTIQKRPPPEMPSDPSQSLPYLCTNYVAYCTREPSIMAAMALAHSRIKAIIFRIPDEHRGGLVSRLCLHGIPTINHHFNVYHCVGEEADADADIDTEEREKEKGRNHK